MEIGLLKCCIQFLVGDHPEENDDGNDDDCTRIRQRPNILLSQLVLKHL